MIAFNALYISPLPYKRNRFVGVKSVADYIAEAYYFIRVQFIYFGKRGFQRENVGMHVGDNHISHAFYYTLFYSVCQCYMFKIIAHCTEF